VEIENMIGGKSTHPVFSIPGGVSRRLKPEERDRIRELADALVEFCEFTLTVVNDVILSNEEYMKIILNKDLYYHESYHLGMVDEDGYLHVVGRKRDTINRGGYVIYPRELEDLLRLHPAVQEAAVVGVEDEVQGELTCACVLPVEGAIVTGDEVKEFCRGRIAQYKVPDLVRFVDAFPMTGSGKIRRVELARMVRAEQAARRT